ncbi:MAG: cob(I)yrinic acid a,c-diamide adenosyltransferase [Blautia massiliensis (ex Durand et al. 2017)]
MIHLYWGDGKGKTTAAMGLALRALGHGRRVVIVQFLKDGTSGELAPLRRLGAVVYTRCEAKFTWQMSAEERACAREAFTELLRSADREQADLLVLDEACAVCAADLIDGELLRRVALETGRRAEVVLTGRTPAAWMLESADYSTEMRAHRHPFAQGTAAREGIEY